MMKLFLLAMVCIPLKLFLTTNATQVSLAKPGCQDRCGNLSVPFPYGIGTGCYLHKAFEVLCNGSSQDIAPLQFVNNFKFSILEITMESVHVVGKPAVRCNDSMTIWPDNQAPLDGYLSYSHDRNIYAGVGCEIGVDVVKECECPTPCLIPPFIRFNTCTTNGCCHRNVPIEFNDITLPLNGTKNTFAISSGEGIAKGNFNLFPVELIWVIGLGSCHQALKRGESLCGQNSYCADATIDHGHNCRCMEGYEGNPYLLNGCQDINECMQRRNYTCGSGEHCVNTPGSFKCMPYHHTKIVWEIVALIGLSAFSTAIGYWAFIKHAEKKKKKIKKHYFTRNGGNVLEQQISANKSFVTKIKIHGVEEMEKATEGFSQKRFLGKGGQGTVYKGLLSDGTVVAIKRLNAVDEDQVEQFVNELLILAHINHRNIVKILGCCLEYKVPLLVYEYLSNGALSQHLHDGAEVSKLSWKDRIRIAREVAGALAYLHSYASTTIFHRDIKPVNILLDENYKAVVCDFGLSRSVTLSKTHLTTQIEGTFGYLDPEYFQSGKLTAKSDVFAFGVVLTELLTRRSISSRDFDEGLISRFQYLVKDNRVFEILDKQVAEEARVDDVLLVITLAKRCIKRNSKKRPNMIEVVSELDKLKASTTRTSS